MASVKHLGHILQYIIIKQNVRQIIISYIVYMNIGECDFITINCPEMRTYSTG